MARKGWASLSPAYKARLQKGGINQSEYDAGASLSAARGHAKTPEHVTGKVDKKRYPEYYNKRKALLQKVRERKFAAWGERPRWDDAVSAAALREKPPTIKQMEWMINEATDEDLLDALRDDSETFRWLGYH